MTLMIFVEYDKDQQLLIFFNEFSSGKKRALPNCSDLKRSFESNLQKYTIGSI